MHVFSHPSLTVLLEREQYRRMKLGYLTLKIIPACPGGISPLTEGLKNKTISFLSGALHPILAQGDNTNGLKSKNVLNASQGTMWLVYILPGFWLMASSLVTGLLPDFKFMWSFWNLIGDTVKGYEVCLVCFCTHLGVFGINNCGLMQKPSYVFFLFFVKPGL